MSSVAPTRGARGFYALMGDAPDAARTSPLLASIRDEPVLVQAIVLIVIALANHFGLPLGHDAELGVNLIALGVVPMIARRFTSPAKPSPTPAAAGPSAARPPKELPMTLEQFEAAAKAKLDQAATLLRNLLAALPPEFQHDAIKAAQDGVGEIADLATAEVEKVAPPSLDGLIEAGKAAIQADADKRIAALDQVKSTLAPAA